VITVSSSPSPTKITSTVSTLIEREGGLVPFIRNVGFGGIAYAIILQIIAGVQGFGTIILGPVRALGEGLILLVDSTIGGLIDVLDAGTAATVRSFADGTAALLGPLAQPAAVGIMMLSLGVFILSVNNLPISPLSFLQNLRQ